MTRPNEWVIGEWQMTEREGLALAIGILIGLAIAVVPPLVYEPFAISLSQRLHDCALRVAAGTRVDVLNLEISKSHRYGVCADGAGAIADLSREITIHR